MKRFNRKIIPAVILMLAVILSFCYGMNKVASVPVNASLAGEMPTIVVDAGHGGIDPGAIGGDGTLEKGINLAISQKLEMILRTYGFKVVMTRTDDNLICDEGLTTIREKKRSDITKRLKISESLSDAILVSIHQNKFEQSKYYGTQVFYSPKNTASKEIAQVIQSDIIESLQNENTRQVKSVGSEIYLLYHSENPAVMVECGFMSNPNELQKLKTDEYQSKMAFLIASGILEYCSAK